MDPTDHEDIIWLHTHLTSQADGLSEIYERIAFSIRRLLDEKAALQSRLEDLERENASAQVRRLREENSVLRANLATAAKERSEATWERDALLRKLNGIKQLIDGPAAAVGGKDVSTDRQNVERPRLAGPRTARPSSHVSHVHTITQVSGPAEPEPEPEPEPEHTSPSSRTHASEPKTDVTIVHDTFGRIAHPRPLVASTSTSTSSPPQASHPLSMHTTMTPIDLSPPRPQDTALRARGAPLIDARGAVASPSGPRTPPALRILNNNNNNNNTGSIAISPLRRPPSPSRILSLHLSPGISEGLSVQYDDAPAPGPVPSGSGSAGAGAAVAAVQKWRIHFAKPPASAAVVALAKPVTTAALVQNLELDEEARRSIERLSSRQTGTLGLHICEPFGLAFLYDPILLESPEATYVVEWCELKASHITKAYIASAKERHTELHTFVYAPRRNGWHYLGQQRWSMGSIKSIWHSLAPLAQRAVVNRSSQDASPADISRGLKQGQIEQLTIELQQVSLTQPNAAESVLMKKLRE
ncbi:hypothetical protein BJV74DRAFT_886342 [Russula compacta]|nr:hypothetical protein BJV74DRAFT_886342 [Russula compacta]